MVMCILHNGRVPASVLLVDTPDNGTRVKILKAPCAADLDTLVLILSFSSATTKTNMLSLLPFTDTVGVIGMVDSPFSDNGIGHRGQ